MMGEPMNDAFKLARNDVEGAARVYRDTVLRARDSEELADVVSVLLQLQDDPSSLERQLAAIAREADVAAALARLLP
jgi:hypothetical protein